MVWSKVQKQDVILFWHTRNPTSREKERYDRGEEEGKRCKKQITGATTKKKNTERSRQFFNFSALALGFRGCAQPVCSKCNLCGHPGSSRLNFEPFFGKRITKIFNRDRDFVRRTGLIRVYCLSFSVSPVWFCSVSLLLLVKLVL